MGRYASTFLVVGVKGQVPHVQYLSMHFMKVVKRCLLLGSFKKLAVSVFALHVASLRFVFLQPWPLLAEGKRGCPAAVFVPIELRIHDRQNLSVLL